MNGERYETGGPVFPEEKHFFLKDGSIDYIEKKGMTLRDYFAGQALTFLQPNSKTLCDNVANDAYNIADAMLKERNK